MSILGHITTFKAQGAEEARLGRIQPYQQLHHALEHIEGCQFYPDGAFFCKYSNKHTIPTLRKRRERERGGMEDKGWEERMGT